MNTKDSVEKFPFIMGTVALTLVTASVLLYFFYT
jgi:hypothetical protein